MAELKDLFKAKTKYVAGLEGEGVEQYAEVDEALKQVTFLYTHLDVSSRGYFKEIRDGQFVDKPFPRANAAVGDQMNAPMDVSPLESQDEGQVDDSPAAI